MSGHSKWSKVKHIKGPLDAKRGQIFSRLSRELSIASKQGGKDPTLNARLRQAITAAKAQNMPNDTVERAIKKGAGELEGAAYDEILYEGYGPAGVAMMVEVATDNKNRTAAEMRRIFSRGNGNLGTSGSVAYLFDRKGEIQIPVEVCSAEEIVEMALEAGADDVQSDSDHHIFLTSPESLSSVAETLRATNLPLSSERLIYIPQVNVTIGDPTIASQVLHLYEALDEQDDTIHVYSNFDIADDVLEQLNL